jgi:hypothetical protein
MAAGVTDWLCSVEDLVAPGKPTSSRGRKEHGVGETSMPDTIRCPYCIEGGDFKGMKVKAEGEWFLCVQFGHIAIPSHPSYLCSCPKCTERRPPPTFVL